MNNQQLVVRLLAEQRKRCLATILTSAENSPWWDTLTPVQQQTYRDQVRSALAVLYDFARDVIKVGDDDGVRNDMALIELMRSVYSQQQRIIAQINGVPT